MLFLSSPKAIEIGFTRARVEHNETQATFMAVLEKDRQSDQTFVIRIQISTPRIPEVGEPASSSVDFVVGTTSVISARLTPEVNSTLLAYVINNDQIPENTEFFQLSSDRNPGTPNNPDFDCDDDPTSRFNGHDCFSNLQVIILDNDGKTLSLLGTTSSVLKTRALAILAFKEISYMPTKPTKSKPSF